MKKLLIVCFFFMLAFFAYSQEVNLEGVLEYSVPIKIPAGTRGTNPSLELKYNSSSDNGRVGVGWSLDGIGYIYRDFSYQINFDSNDHYEYMGSKLIKGSGNRYYMQKENYSKIEAFNLNTPDSYWIITNKDGTRLYFGATVDSHIDAVGKNGRALVWGLNKVIDVHGNYYTIQYNEDLINGDFYPARIIYSNNDTYAISGDYTIDFTYENRTDHWKKYLPTLVDMDKRLKWISVNVNSSLLRRYRLNYEYGSKGSLSRLVSVQEYGSDGTSALPSKIFEYDYGQKGYDYTPGYNPALMAGRDSSARGGWDYGTRFVDLNGDGLLDMVQSHYNYGIQNKGAWINTGSGWSYDHDLVPPVLIAGRDAGSPSGWDYGTRFVDLNGDVYDKKSQALF